MARRPMTIAPGSVVFGGNGERYVVTRELDHGSFGKVFVVAKEGSDEEFALKIPLDENESPLVPASIRNEGQLAVEINDPNVIRFYYFHDGLRYQGLPPYIIMELADGGSLEALIERQRQSDRQFTTAELTERFLQLARGMKAINAKLVHRDVRPSNVLIHQGVLKIADFSLAKEVCGATRRLTFQGMASPGYMAPEAWSGLRSDTVKTDMYSTGLVLYELSTLRRPYSVHQRGAAAVPEWRKAHLYGVPEPPDRLNPDVPSWMAALVLRLLAKLPEDRFSSWDEVIYYLSSGEGADTGDAAKDPHLRQILNKAKAAEQEALRLGQLAEDKGEREKAVRSAFTKIVETLDSLARDFNRESGAGQMSVDASSDDLTVTLTGPLGRLVCRFYVATDMRLRGQEILAWGTVAVEGACEPPLGFNLALAYTGEADGLGRWITLEHHRWLRKHEHSRSLALQEKELRQRLEAIDATERVETRARPFSRDDVYNLLSGESRLD